MRSFYFFIANFILAIFISGTVYADTVYTIKKGDSPYSIAKKFKVSPRDIMKANNLKPGNLKPGAKITVPSDKKEPSNKNTAAGKRDKKTGNKNVTAAKNIEDVSVHTVKKGDTLLSISKKYSLSINELKELNNFRSAKLKTGQKIFVKKVGPKTYTVKKGDTLYQIAKKYDMEPDEIKGINHLETEVLKPVKNPFGASRRSKQTKNLRCNSFTGSWRKRYRANSRI